jgi:hypothetical protein
MMLWLGTNADVSKSNLGSIQHPFLESYNKQRLQQWAEKVRQQKKTVIWFVWFVSFVWLNQIDQMNQINKTNQFEHPATSSPPQSVVLTG